VQCRDNSATRAHTVCVFVNLDGFGCGGIILDNTTDPCDSDPSDSDSDSDSEISESTTDLNSNTITERDDTAVMADLRETDTTAKPFMFSHIETTGISSRHDFKYWLPHCYPDEETCMDVSSDGLGQIEIEVWKVALGNDSRPMKVHFETERKLHERAKKGLNHCVG
jgi:hypothetical protein